jgi:hypothetical protein
MVDYTSKIPSCIKAQGQGGNALILRKLESRVKRLDGKYAGYEIEHRWLSETCEHSDDEAYVCVEGSEFTLWQRKEIKEILTCSELNMHEFFLVL